jgi:hypothetical protein
VSYAGWNAGRHAFIVKGRERVQWETTTYTGVRRRIKRWSKWIGHDYCLTEDEAREKLKRRRRVGLTDWAIFHKGKRLNG